MKTSHFVIIGIIIAATISITSISLAYNQEIKLATGMITSDEKPQPQRILSDPICFVTNRTSSGDKGSAVTLDRCITLNEFEEMGCTKPILEHILRYSNLLDYEADGPVYLEWAGLSHGISQKEFDECFNAILEKRPILDSVPDDESKITNSLEIPNAKRDAKLAAGCKLYPGAGWTCPDIEAVNLDSIATMKPDHVELFYYPNPEDTENRDPFQLFMIIRLPEWLGGGVNDVSAYRVYSTQSVDDPCMVKYWSGEDRQRIENPCKGGFYRVYDGIMILGFGSVPNTHPVALPHLDLSSDENGFLFIEPPSFTKTENGVIGYGREISQKEIADGSQFYIDSFAKHFPTYPKIHKNFAGLMLADIVPLDRGVKILYSDFGPISNLVDVTIFACNCDNIRGHHPYETIETINGITVAIHDTKSQHPQVNESVNTYYYRFAKDGHEYNISGKDPDSIRTSIISLLTNYNVPITPEIGKTGTYKLENDGTIYDVKYSISGASIEDVSMNDIEQSLFVEIDSVHSGSLEITIPRELHDSKHDYCPPKKSNPPDDSFFVLLDGMEIAYDETQTTSEFRTLMIPFDSNSGIIEIVSTCLV